MNIILCGYNWAGCAALKKIIPRSSSLFVFTKENPYYINSLKNYCIKLGVPYSLDKIDKKLLPFKPDLIVSIYYPYIIKEDVIKYCDYKIINLHPSLLPKYRGCSSVTWSIVNGEKYYGFTYHYINKEIDKGNIIIQKKLDLEEWDTQETAYTRVMYYALDSFNQALECVINNYPGVKQTGKSSYYPRGCPLNGEIDDSWSLVEIERFIRAMTYPPYSSATYKRKAVKSIKEYIELINKD